MFIFKYKMITTNNSTLITIYCRNTMCNNILYFSMFFFMMQMFR